MNEIRQKFEDWAMPQHYNVYRRGESYVDDHTARDWNTWRAAYEAGEIAMKEKAAQRIHHAFCRTIDRMQNICDCDELAESIRALPLSGAEEKNL